MINLQEKRDALKKTSLEMFLLCEKQMIKARDAFLNNDKLQAKDVIRTENKVNALDLKIDRDCERFIAKYNPVAGDLRFVLGLRKINFDLEKIADYAYGIAKYSIEADISIPTELLKKLRFYEMYECALSMLGDTIEIFNGNGTELTKAVFKKEKLLNKINSNSFKIISKDVKIDPELIDQYLLLFLIIKKTEKIGDLITTIAEEIVYYRKAKVLKHQKKKKV